MLRYKLRTLLIVLALGPPVMAGAWFSETRPFVTPLAGAFLGAMFLPYGVRAGLGIAAVIVVVNTILMEKDPSGLGPNELVIPIQLAAFALPAAGFAWLGRVARELLEPEFS
jgi:hypothetical protein